MEVFNTQSRKKNVMQSSFWGGFANIIKILLGFVNRSVFIYILSVDYLGINGLFTNILSVLSLAELGVTTAIVYRFYEPISKGDIVRVGRLMNFLKKVYNTIALVMAISGMLVLPFIKFLINSQSQIPGDINLHVIYLLFLFQSATSYLFVYKQSILSADQKNYLISVFQVGNSVLLCLLQIVVLLIWRNYTLSLALNICTGLLYNYVVSLWVTKKYSPVFEVKETLSKEEQKIIFEDTKATMYHKVGSTVLNSTDNIVITKMISLTATGLYSNYSMIFICLKRLLCQVLGTFVSSIGNAKNDLEKDEYYNIFMLRPFQPDLQLT